jgi:hypothetical protein
MIKSDPLKFWTPEGFEISSYKWGISNRKNSSYTTSGSDNTGKCIYTYNEIGFRGDSIHKEGFKIMSIGDSNTEGVGVKDTETWSSQFSRYIPNSVNLNMGTGGRSNDYISRCLLTFYDLLKPDLVLIMYTLPQRREFYTQNGGVEPFMPTDSWGYLKETDEGRFIQDRLTLIQNDKEDTINWYKNHNLIKYFLESKKCNWLWNGWMDIPKDYQEFNRFDGNYGTFSDFGSDGVHPGPNHNRRYAKNLINHISQKFSNYIPSILNEEDVNVNYKKII